MCVLPCSFLKWHILFWNLVMKTTIHNCNATSYDSFHSDHSSFHSDHSYDIHHNHFQVTILVLNLSLKEISRRLGPHLWSIRGPWFLSHYKYIFYYRKKKSGRQKTPKYILLMLFFHNNIFYKILSKSIACRKIMICWNPR